MASQSSSDIDDTDNEVSALGFDEPTISAATVDVSLLHHEKDILVEKTKAQDNEIMSLKLKLEAFEKRNEELQCNNSSEALSHDDKIALEQEISVLRGKVALLERNNKVFSNEERKELKQELERTKRRFQRLNEQLASVRNSMEYDHINHVERALENFVKKVKTLEKENNDLRKMNITDGHGKDDLSTQMIEEKEEIIKDQNVMIEELEHQIRALKAGTLQDQVLNSGSLRDNSESNTERASKSASPIRHRSPLRSSRSRLSSTRSRRNRSEDKSGSASDRSSTDTDARAVREMCNKMRQDVGEAKKRLKDMGEDLDVRHMSPTHVSRSQGWVVFDTARSAPAGILMRDDETPSPKVPLSARSRLEDDISAMQILTQRSSASPRGRSAHTDMLSSDQKTSGSAGNLDSVPSIEIPSPIPSARGLTSNGGLNSTWPMQNDMDGTHTVSRKSVRLNEDDYRNSTLLRQSNADFMRLLSRYEFLRIRALDHKFLEFQQECRHVAMLELLKLRHQEKIENSKLPAEKKRKRSRRIADSEGSGNREGNSMKLNQLFDNDPAFPKPSKLSAVPPSYKSYYSLPENSDIQGSTYRIYVAKKEYNPPEEKRVEGKNIFAKIKLSVGDVATSLGAPHIRDDGKKYQLVHVNDMIGLVPFSFLQLAEKVQHCDGEETLSKSLTSTNLGRITRMHKTLELRRKLMPEVA